MAFSLVLSCNSATFFTNEEFTWQNDTIKMNDGSIKAYAPDAYTIISNYPDSEFPDGVWKLSHDISHLPSYSAPTRLEEAIYNLSLEESVIAVESDSTLRTGKKWSGVWTRDVSYSILLALSHVQTQASINSLVRKVDSLGRIIQDTGTGGSWPCSTDRTIWAVAAWEIYKVTGDRQWLEYVYPIIKRSLETDFLTIYDKCTYMAKGESSFLDWREQEYPRWMAPVDIYKSENLGTVCVHYEAVRVLERMAVILGDSQADEYAKIADSIENSINELLWMPDRGYYAQYRYGRRNLITSPRFETLGEALAIIYGIADSEMAKAICANAPELPFGTPCFYPHIADIPPYHNDAMWPFVQAFWMDACKEAGNETAVLKAMASIYRLAAFCLTNKENMVIYDGRWQGTRINSSRQLWSIAGNLNIVYSVLFGMQFHEDGLYFRPFVPKAISGERKLTSFNYRGETYDIVLKGYGDGIRSFTLDGKESDNFIPAASAGEGQRHFIVIELNGKSPKGNVTRLQNAYSPLTPSCSIDDGLLIWNPVGETIQYEVIRDGEVVATTSETSFELSEYGEYQVIAIGENGYESFASEPLDYFGEHSVVYDLEDCCKGVKMDSAPYMGYLGKGYVDLTLDKNLKFDIVVNVAEAGTYDVDFLFANANGPINTKNKCSIRSLFVDSEPIGIVVMPHCGNDAFGVWRWTNVQKVELAAGEHTFTLEYRPENCNMNIQVNSSAIDCIRLCRRD